MANVFKASAAQTVQNNDIETLSQKPVYGVTANKTSPTSNQNPQTNNTKPIKPQTKT
jgi:hypothetical protein